MHRFCPFIGESTKSQLHLPIEVSLYHELENGDEEVFWSAEYVTRVDPEAKLELRDVEVTVAPHAKRGTASLTWDTLKRSSLTNRILTFIHT